MTDKFEILDGDIIQTPEGSSVAVLTHNCGIYKMVSISNRDTVPVTKYNLMSSNVWISFFDGKYGRSWSLWRSQGRRDDSIIYSKVLRKRSTVEEIHTAIRHGDIATVSDLLQVLYNEGFTDGLNSHKDKP